MRSPPSTPPSLFASVVWCVLPPVGHACVRQAHLGDLSGLANGDPMVDGVKYEPTKVRKSSQLPALSLPPAGTPSGTECYRRFVSLQLWPVSRTCGIVVIIVYGCGSHHHHHPLTLGDGGVMRCIL